MQVEQERRPLKQCNHIGSHAVRNSNRKYKLNGLDQLGPAIQLELCALSSAEVLSFSPGVRVFYSLTLFKSVYSAEI